MNLELAKTNMIKQQIRTYDVTDATVLNLFEHINRADFVAPEYQDLAYADMMLPISCGQVMLSPKDQAKMLQALNIKPTETVLEIGTGNGFFTALLAKLSLAVTSVEIHEALSIEAEQHLQRLNIHNVNLQVGNGSYGWKLETPVDIIVITGSLPFLPQNFKNCLKEQGRIMAILGDKPAAMQVSLITPEGDTYKINPIFETEVPELEKALQPERFVF